MSGMSWEGCTSYTSNTSQSNWFQISPVIVIYTMMRSKMHGTWDFFFFWLAVLKFHISFKQPKSELKRLSCFSILHTAVELLSSCCVVSVLCVIIGCQICTNYTNQRIMFQQQVLSSRLFQIVLSRFLRIPCPSQVESFSCTLLKQASSPQNCVTCIK